MKILVAPDKFKGCLTATQVARQLANGIRTVPELEVLTLPMADGGDGSIEAAIAAGFRRIPVNVAGPTGELHEACIAYDGHTALVEVANTCGLALLAGRQLEPLASSSAGIGDAMLAALSLKPQSIVLALGGSASTDGGLGMLVALGAVARDAEGRALRGNGADLSRLTDLDLASMITPPCEIIVATDVTAPLSGPEGAAYVFAPQKGAGPEVVTELDRGLRRLAAITDPTGDLASMPGAGAAGGLGFAALLMGGRLVAGADYFLELFDFDAVVMHVDAVVTGEGNFDDQTLCGKLPFAVAQRSHPRPVHIVTGRDSTTDPVAVAHQFTAVHQLSTLTERDTTQDPVLSGRLLAAIGADIAATYARPDTEQNARKEYHRD